MKYIIHLFLFGLAWGACVFGAHVGAAWISFGMSVTCLTLAILICSPKRRIDILKVALIVPLGVGFEYFNEFLPLYTFIPESKYPPVWMLCFWPAFSILFIEVLEFLYPRHLIVKFIFGFLGGMSYWPGQYLGLIQFQGNPYLSMVIFAGIWAVQFVLLLRISEAIDRRFSA